MIKKISTGDLQNLLSLNCYFGITDIPKNISSRLLHLIKFQVCFSTMETIGGQKGLKCGKLLKVQENL